MPADERKGVEVGGIEPEATGADEGPCSRPERLKFGKADEEAEMYRRAVAFIRSKAKQDDHEEDNTP